MLAECTAQNATASYHILDQLLLLLSTTNYHKYLLFTQKYDYLCIDTTFIARIHLNDHGTPLVTQRSLLSSVIK